MRGMGKQRKPGVLYSGGTRGNPSTLGFAVWHVAREGKQWLFGVREHAKEPRPCPVPDHSNSLYFCCFIHFSKIALYTFSFGLYTTTVRKIG